MPPRQGRAIRAWEEPPLKRALRPQGGRGNKHKHKFRDLKRRAHRDRKGDFLREGCFPDVVSEPEDQSDESEEDRYDGNTEHGWEPWFGEGDEQYEDLLLASEKEEEDGNEEHDLTTDFGDGDFGEPTNDSRTESEVNSDWETSSQGQDEGTSEDGLEI